VARAAAALSGRWRTGTTVATYRSAWALGISNGDGEAARVQGNVEVVS